MQVIKDNFFRTLNNRIQEKRDHQLVLQNDIKNFQSAVDALLQEIAGWFYTSPVSCQMGLTQLTEEDEVFPVNTLTLSCDNRVITIVPQCLRSTSMTGDLTVTVANPDVPTTSSFSLHWKVMNPPSSSWMCSSSATITAFNQDVFFDLIWDFVR